MLNQIFELFQYSETSLLAVSSHNPWLVLLSVTIAIFASYMGFQVASQASTASIFRKHVSLLVGSIVLGCGVWSMHFIGMLALELCTSVTYKFDLTAVSVLPAIVASWVALNLITRENIKMSQLVLGGVLVGAGIGTMHYVGMAAMDMSVLLRYDIFMFCLSIVVAVVLAILSLWISFGLKQFGDTSLSKNMKMLISSSVMGAAISGMHYTGMAAARFVLPPGLEISNQTNAISLYLALGVTGITVIIIGMVLAVNVLFSYKDKSVIAERNEKRLTAIMDTAIDGVITIDASGKIISINKAVSKILGWQESELLNSSIGMIAPESFQHNFNQYIDNYIETRHAKLIGSEHELEIIAKNQEEVPVLLSIGHVELNEQHLFVIFISDLRERREMAAELQKKDTLIHALLKNIPGIVYRCFDRSGWPCIFLNDEVEKILGYPKEDFLMPEPKRSLADFIHPEDLDRIESTDLRGPDGFCNEHRFIDRYGTIKWVLAYGRASKIDDSDEYYLDGFIMDISERKQMESELVLAKEVAEKAAETRAAFLANMSHEIRTPMNAVIGFSDILLDDELSAYQRKHLGTINQSAKSLLHILNDILDSAKLDKGKTQLEYRDFSLVEEVDAVVSTLWLQAQSKGLALTLNVHPSVQEFYNGAPDRIRQVLTNIIGNAIKFTEQGTVSIDIFQAENHMITFVIKDTGIGMTASQLATIFEAFSQADESMSRRFGGTGLGTTISKQLVELMQGSISATSVEGVGSEFTFSLPLKPAIKSVENLTSHKMAAIPKLRILVVDDIEQNIDLLTLMLKRNGHEVIEARDGEQALVQMQENELDIVLMDIQMPKMDGLTAAKQRRQFEALNGLTTLPIIALTASVLPQDKASAEQAGMDGFANKPIDMQQINHEILSALNLDNVAQESHQDIASTALVIDVKKGIELWGSRTTLYSEISRFLKDAKTDVVQLEDMLEQQNLQQISMISHKLKGGAGNLSLNRFMLSLGALEQSSNDHNVELIAENIAKVIAELHQAVNCLNKKDIEQAAVALQPLENSENSNEELIEILQQLTPYVSNNEFNDALLDKLQSHVSSKTIEINNIIDACENFEFTQALEQIESLIETLKPSSS